MSSIILTLLMSIQLQASLANVYIANNSAGADNGTNCANAHEGFAFLITGSGTNWGTGSTQVGPGTTIHHCGVITYSLAFFLDGSAGNTIAYLFEPGGKFSAGNWNAEAALLSQGHSYLTINGGLVNIGGSTPNIEATSNGSGLATSLASTGIDISSSSNVEILNLGCSNLYIHSSLSDGSISSDTSSCVHGNPIGQGILIHDSTFHDNQDGILIIGAASGSNSLQLYNMDMSHMDHFLFTDCAASGTSSGYLIHDNQIHDPANWDTTGNFYHHDGWIMDINTGQTCDGIYAYNNLFGGDWGANNTSPLFFDQNAGTVDNQYIFNNVFLNTNASFPWSNGIALETYPGPVHFWNNTIICPSVGGASMEVISLNIDIRNNVESGCQGYYNSSVATAPTISVAAFDYNWYSNLVSSGGGAWSYLTSHTTAGQTLSQQFTAWQTIIQAQLSGTEVHSGQSASAGIASSGTVNAGSPLIGAGVNLCNGIISCTGTLAALLNGTSAGNTITTAPRSATGAWTIGAYSIGTQAIKSVGASQSVGASGAVN